MYKAIIFDMDWVLTESEYTTFLSDQFTLNKYWVTNLSIDDYTPNTWKSLKLRIPFYEDKFKIKIDFEEFSEIFISKQLELLLDELSTQKEKIVSFFQKLKDKELKLAVATSAREKKARPILKTLWVLSFLDFFIHLDNVNNCKPNPEPYLKSAKNLWLDPRECLVIEDSLWGIEAWKTAWMIVLAMKSDAFSKEEQSRVGADNFINDLNDILKYI